MDGDGHTRRDQAAEQTLESLNQQVVEYEDKLARAQQLSAERDDKIAELKSWLLSASDTALDEEEVEEGKRILLRQLEAELKSENTSLRALQNEHTRLQADMNTRVPIQRERVLKVKEECKEWKRKYDDLVVDIGRLEHRMLRILSIKSDSNSQLGSMQATLTQKKRRLEKVVEKLELVRASIPTVEKTAEEAQQHLEQARAELAECQRMVEEAEAKNVTGTNASDQGENIDFDWEGTRELAHEQEKQLGETFQQELALSEELDLFKDRLESVRTEFRSYKVKVSSEMAELKTMLVGAQQELGYAREREVGKK